MRRLPSPFLLLVILLAGCQRTGGRTGACLRALCRATPSMPRVRARAERVLLRAAEPLDLLGRDGATVGGVALDPDPALPVPAPQRVEADPERARRLARSHFPRHCLCTLPERQRSVNLLPSLSSGHRGASRARLRSHP